MYYFIFLEYDSCITLYFQSIADAMTITLPFVAHEMGEGFQLIKDSWKFWENPMESFKGIEMALVKQVIFVSKFHTVIDIRDQLGISQIY